MIFEKKLIVSHGQLPAELICPGHPLLDATIDLVLERYSGIMRQGAVLVDELDSGTVPRMVLYVEHTIQGNTQTQSNKRLVISKRMSYVEMNADGTLGLLHHAPYLDCRPLKEGESTVAEILQWPECAWLGDKPHEKAEEYAIEHIIPEHLGEVSSRRQESLAKTKAAIKDRLTKEIIYWSHRAEELILQEQAGRANPRLSSNSAKRRARDLQIRLEARMENLESEERPATRLPVVRGGMLVVPIGLIHAKAPDYIKRPISVDTQRVAARARQIVMDEERKLGYEPVDCEHEKLGYDIESRVPSTDSLHFIEVKGRMQNAATITMIRNEILYSEQAK